MMTGGLRGGRGNRMSGSIDEMAPLPNRADVLPDGTRVYQMDILFEIELISAEERFAGANSDEEPQQ